MATKGAKMPSAADVLRIAEAEVGYSRWDDPLPGTKYGRWYAQITDSPYFGTSGAGKSVTAQTAIQLSTVYACVRVISETVASLPLGVYEAADDGNLKAGDHPLYHLLHDEPNAEMTSFVFREVMLAHLLLYGNSYSQIIRSGKNTVVGLYPRCSRITWMWIGTARAT